jgi:flagellar basal body P-ring formation protein FlgA
MKSAAVLLFAVLMVSTSPGAADAAVLRGHATVDSDMVRLGDLFANTGAKAENIVAPAPQAGATQVFDAEMLRDVARRSGIGWEPRSRYDRVVVERAAIVVPHEEIVAQVREALIAGGMPVDRRIELSQRDYSFHVPPGREDALRVENARLDGRTGRFAAALIVPRGGQSTDRMHLTGRVHEMVEVPVLSRRVNRGEVIGRSDIDTIEMPRETVARNAILDPAQLIGQTPRRLLAENTPLRHSDVQAPTVVAKGTLVTVVLRTDRMLITARGRALDDAANGEVVRVLNTQSRATIEGVATGPNEVVIDPTATLR